jgi:hypothetical protein
MAAINSVTRTEAQRIAAQRYPYSARVHKIFGNGDFGVVSKCGGVEMIKLYQTADERGPAVNRSCGRNCNMHHIAEDFHG